MSNTKDSQNINRFNGQYLKCVVTNYESTMTILKNSGTLIVHRPLDEDYNYLYLGNEFLSSGYGQKDIETRDKLTYLANTYTDTFSYFNNAYSYSLNYIEEDYNAILNKLNEYVKIDGGDITNTMLTYPPEGTNSYKTSDIVLEGPEAEYKDLSVETVDKYVNSSQYSDGMVMPVGDQILKVEMLLNGSRNDSGGVLGVSFNYNHNSSVIDPAIYTGKNVKVYSSNATNAADTFNIRCSLLYDKNMFYFIQEGDNKIVNKVAIDVAKTPKNRYKNYPKLEKKDIKITSDFNAIEQHTIGLSGINIIGKHTVSLITSQATHDDRYNTVTFPSLVDIETEENDLKPSNYYINNINNKYFNRVKRQFVDDDIYFDIEVDTYLISFVIPNKWKAYEVYFIENSTGIIHNWTGAVHVDYSEPFGPNGNANINMVQIGKSRYVKCDRYTIIMSDGVQQAGKLYIRTYDTNPEEQQEVVVNNTIEDTFTYDTALKSYDLLYNENFTSIYWLTYNMLGKSVSESGNLNELEANRNIMIKKLLKRSAYNAANIPIRRPIYIDR